MLLELGDRIGLLQQIAELIDSLHQTIAGKAVERELDFTAIGQPQQALIDVDRDVCARVAEQPRMRLGIDDDRHQSVFNALFRKISAICVLITAWIP